MGIYAVIYIFQPETEIIDKKGGSKIAFWNAKTEEKQ